MIWAAAPGRQPKGQGIIAAGGCAGAGNGIGNPRGEGIHTGRSLEEQGETKRIEAEK
jgi:hypothetical protein